MDQHHNIPKSRGGPDDEWNLVEMNDYDHAYKHAVDFVLFDHAPRFDFRLNAWLLLPDDLREAVLAQTSQRQAEWNVRHNTGKKLDKSHRRKISEGMKKLPKGRKRNYKRKPCPYCGISLFPGPLGNHIKKHKP